MINVLTIILCLVLMALMLTLVVTFPGELGSLIDDNAENPFDDQ